MSEFNLTYSEINEVNVRYSQIRNDPIYYKCVKCNGTGLTNYRKFGEFTTWSEGSYCETCKGRGIFDFVENVICGAGIETEEVVNNNG